MAKKTGVAFKPETFEEHKQAVALVKRFLPPKPEVKAFRPDVNDPRLKFRCTADSASVGDVPQYAAVQPIPESFTDADGEPILRIQKPDTDNLTTCALMSAHGMPLQNPTTGDSGIGRCTFEPFWALYDTGSSTPATGDTLGTVAGQWYLRTGGTGYKALCQGANGRVLVKPVIAQANSLLLLMETNDDLTAGGSVTGHYLEWDGDSWESTGAADTFYDPLDRFTGSAGDRFWVTPKEESGRAEIVSPGAGTATDKIYGLLNRGTVTVSDSGYIFSQVINYLDSKSASNGVTLDVSGGEMTIQTAGLYLIRFSGKAIYIGTLGGVDGLSTQLVALDLYLNGSHVVAQSDLLKVVDGVADYAHFYYEFAYEFDVDDEIHLMYQSSDIESNGDFNNQANTCTLYIEKLPGSLAG